MKPQTIARIDEMLQASKSHACDARTSVEEGDISEALQDLDRLELSIKGAIAELKYL